MKQLTDKHGFYWWGISAVLGCVLWLIPTTLRFGLSEGGTLLLASISLFLLGAVIGFLRPTRPWRWGIASVLLLPFAEIVRFAVSSSEMTGQSVPILAVVLTELVKIPIYGLIAIPALVGAYIGSYSKRRALKSETKLMNKETVLLWMAICFAITLGLLAVILSRIEPIVQADPHFTPFNRGLLDSNILVLSVGLFITGFIMTLFQPTRYWLWATCGGIATFIWTIVIMAHTGPGNLFPIALAFGVGSGLVFSSIGVVIALIVKGKIR